MTQQDQPCRHPLIAPAENLLSAVGALAFGYVVGELVLDELRDPLQWLWGALLTVSFYATVLFAYRLHRVRRNIHAAHHRGRNKRSDTEKYRGRRR